jgi:hypothetical protein
VRLALALVVASLVYSCGSELPRPAYGPPPALAHQEVPYAPPPPRVELVPPQPASRAVWLDGEWTVRRGKWAWMPGRWVLPPQGAVFVRWATGRADDGTLYFEPGSWRDAHGAEVPAPPPLAIATSTSGGVVGPEGELEKTGPNVKPQGSPPRDAGVPDAPAALDAPGAPDTLDADGGP